MPLNEVRLRKRHLKARPRSSLGSEALICLHASRVASALRQRSASVSASDEKTTFQNEATSSSRSASPISSTRSFSSIAIATDAPPAHGSTKSLGRSSWVRKISAMYELSLRLPPGYLSGL